METVRLRLLQPHLFAHAFGERYELPIPLLLFVLGGAGVVVLSFLLVIGRGVKPDKGLNQLDHTHVRGAHLFWGPLSLLAVIACILAGLYGSEAVAENILPTLFWLVVWIAVPLSAGLLGDWTQAVNPFATVAKLADNTQLRRSLLGRPTPLLWRLRWWPAAIAFFVLAAGELVFNQTATQPAVIAAGLLVYFVISAFAGMIYGRAWLERGEIFTVLFATWGRLGFFRFGAPGKRGFAGGLSVPFEADTSRAAFVLLLLVSVAFDGLTATPLWNTMQHHLPTRFAIGGGDYLALATIFFIVLAIAFWVVFSALAAAVSRVGRHAMDASQALAGLLPSLLPISFGYLLAHNLEYLVLNGQLLFPLIGNPVGKEGWPIHLPAPFNDSFEPNLHVLPSSFYWYLAVAVIIAVHIVAVVLAHRHLGRATENTVLARRSEYPWVVAMVAYTMLSLWLLAQPLTKETHHDTDAYRPAKVVAVSAGPVITVDY